MDDEAIAKLPRAERVALLNERTWQMTAAPVEGELVIDGRVSDAAWSRAEPVKSLYQRETNEGLPATESTHVWVLFDETNLYLGFRCFDSDPTRPLARTMFRDENIGSDDAVAVMIDAFNDQRSAVFLATNANGIVFDMLQNGEESSSRNLNWDTVWYARGTQTDTGWEAELVVPFKSLRFEPPEDGRETLFGIGFKRNLPRKNEETYWPFVGNDSTWYRPAEMGTLHGLAKIRPGRAVELRPYVLGGLDQAANFDKTTRTEFGADAKWGVTTGLTADFTVNTDFAQEESDVQQINLTRFSLFFPEKRQIFLESERSFIFGVRREADLVFTRRIGLSSRGGIIPILGGARLSGRQGRSNIGIMNMQTDDVLAGTIPAENFTVLRFRRDIFERSNIGVVFTNRQGGGTYNRVYGADLNLFLGQAWSFESYIAAMDTPEASRRGMESGFAKLEYRTDRYGALYRYLGIGENFRPGIGFVRRPNSHQNRGVLRFSPRPSMAFVRQFHFTGTLDYIPNQAGVLETRWWTGDFQTVYESGDTVTFSYVDAYEFLEEPFELRPDITIEPGAYSFATLTARVDTFRRRHARAGVAYTTGGFWDGQRDTLTLGLDYRVNKHFGVSADYEVNWVDLPSGEFTTHLVASRVQLAFTTDVILMALLQYNTDTQALASNIRFNWIPKPGSDFFVVYNELDEWGRIFGVKNRSLSVKLNYLFAL